MRLVLRTREPSLTAIGSPMMTAPTESSSRLSAIPMTPPSNSSSSVYPYTRQSVDLSNAIAHLDHSAFVDRFELLLPVLDLAPYYRSNVLASDRHFGLPTQ